MHTQVKIKRPRISRENGTPIHTQPVDYRLKKIKKELNFSVWDSIVLQISQLKTHI